MDNENIRVLSDRQVSAEDELKLHFTYSENLTLKELAETFDLTNKAINDLNRENGVGSNAQIGQKYVTTVNKVESGSLVMYIVTNIVVPVGLSILANFLYDRLKKLGSKKDKGQQGSQAGYPISIVVKGDDKTIDIHIEKRDTK